MAGQRPAAGLEITLGDIVQAAERLRGVIWQTPLLEDPELSDRRGARVRLKLECWQRTGSFKVRGAMNRLRCLGPGEAGQGLLAVSAGNHAQGVAVAAREMGYDLLVVMPRTASRVKIEATRRLGARVELLGEDYDAADAAAREIQRTSGRLFIHPFEDPLVIAGQGTVGLEIALAPDPPASVLIPAGGGGLAVGCAVALHGLLPSLRVLGVQSEASAPLVAAFQAGRHVPVKFAPSLADGLHGDTTSGMADLAIRHLDGMLAVTEQGIAQAMRHLYAAHRIVVEGSGAAALAAVLEGSAPEGDLDIVVTGRNIDPELFRAIVMEGRSQ